MTLWWIGNAVLLLVVVPALVFVLNRVIRPVLEIERYASDVAEHGASAASSLEALDDAERTPGLAHEARASLERYVSALDGILRAERR